MLSLGVAENITEHREYRENRTESRIYRENNISFSFSRENSITESLERIEKLRTARHFTLVKGIFVLFFYAHCEVLQMRYKKMKKVNSTPNELKGNLKSAIDMAVANYMNDKETGNTSFSRNRVLTMDTVISLLISMHGGSLKKELYDAGIL